MCKVRTGAKVRSNLDLQNLVVSVILRQTVAFSVNDVCEQIKDKLEGSAYQNRCDMVQKHCEDTVGRLYSMDYLKNAGMVGNNRTYKLALSFPSIMVKL